MTGKDLSKKETSEHLVGHLKRYLPSAWAFVGGLISMAALWLYSTHAMLTCPQKTVLVLLSVLALVSLVMATALSQQKHELERKGS